MIKIAVRAGESPEKLLQRFKRICSKEGVIKEIKKRAYYEKPSDKKRRREKEQRRGIGRKPSFTKTREAPTSGA